MRRNGEKGLGGIGSFRGALGFLLGAAFLLTLPSWGQSAPALRQAPLNPAFLQAVQQRKEAAPQLTTASGRGLGWFPPPVDLSHNAGRRPLDLRRAETDLPASFDLRPLGKVTPVRDQGQCGSCWTFGTYGSLESTCLPAKSWDFSENNLKNLAGFDLGPCDGGDDLMATAYLARWSGPVSEADDPYDAFSGVSPLGLPARMHVQNVYALPDRTSPTDNDAIKAAVMTYGAVNVSMYWGDSSFDGSTNAYYYSGKAQPNHSVTLVGWDDNYDKSNFRPQPPGNGAFIIKNSWGDSWGDSGYFYMSYYDTWAGSYARVFTAEPLTDYDVIYQYDPLGWVDQVGYGGDTAWGAGEFKADGDQDVTAVGFYNTTTGGSYTLSLYTDGDGSPTSGNLAESQSGNLPEAGYLTLSLDTPVDVTPGETFSVVLQLTSPGYDYPLAVQYAASGYSSQAPSAPGQTFASADGQSWEDLYTSSDGIHRTFCLKAFANLVAGLNVTSVQPAQGSTLGGTALTLSGTGFLSGASVTFDGQPAPGAVLNADGTLTAVAPAHADGTATIAVTNPDGRTASLPGGYRYVDVPVISGIRKLASPFRLAITGSLFHSQCTVKINGTAVPITTLRRDGTLLARQGKALKAMVPKGAAVSVTVTNNDESSTSVPFTFTW